MTQEQMVILIVLGVLLALCIIVSATLNHYIGGFLQTVAREEEENDAERAEARTDGNKQESKS